MRSGETQYDVWPPGTWTMRRSTVDPWPARESHLTPCATPRPCDSSRRGSTRRSSRFGLATNNPEPHSSTCARTCDSKNEHSSAPLRRTPNPVDTEHPTHCSPSSTACEYADHRHHAGLLTRRDVTTVAASPHIRAFRIVAPLRPIIFRRIPANNATVGLRILEL